MTDTKTKWFRVDRRDFATGDVITTAGEFSEKHPKKGKKAEEILARMRPPDKPERPSCLMVFEDADSARAHWCKMNGGKLYEVKVMLSDVLHRADMRLVDKVGETLSDQAEAKRLAESYWSEGVTDEPIFEILLTKAVVTAVISSDDAERKAEFRRRYM